MTRSATLTALVAATFVAAGCGTGRPAGAAEGHPDARRASVTRTRRVRRIHAPLQALVTAQAEDRLLLVGLPGGRVLRTVTVPSGSDYVDAESGVVVVVAADSGTVTLFDRRSLHPLKVFRGFSSPHIPAISLDGKYAYVTDDGSGELTVIGLDDRRLISRVFVGVGAHHLAFTPGERQVWVALGQASQTLALLSTVTRSGTVDLGRPHVIGHFDPGFLVHDLLFSPGGEQVWITSADTSYVGVFSARTHRLLFRVPAGAPPQHLVFANGYAYITSGYGSSIEQVDPHSGHVVRRVPAPYGSFDLDAADDYVVTASLFRGTLAIYGRRLRLLHIGKLASSTEDVALSAP